VKTFLAWDDIKDMQKEGVLDEDSISILLQEVGAKVGGDLDFDQFSKLIMMIDEAAEAMGLDGEEDADVVNELPETEDEVQEVARKIYDELRGKVSSIRRECALCVLSYF